MQSLPSRKPFLSTIGGKVLIGLLGAALLPLIASILIFLFQMNSMNGQARTTSSDALISNAQQSLQVQAANIDQTISKQIQLISNTTQELANYAGYLLDNPDGVFSSGVYNQVATMARDPKGGQWYNPVTEPDSLFLPNTITRLTLDMKTQINILTYLDAVFKAHYDQDQFPTYIGTELGVTRYYAPAAADKNADLAHLVPPNFDVTGRPWYVAAKSDNDPQKVPVLTSLYFDATGKGLVITSSAPIYTSDGTFQGVVGRDVTLSNLLSALPAKIGQNGYAFLVGQDGNIISMPEQGQQDFSVQLAGPDNGQLLDVPLDQHTPNASQLKQRLTQDDAGLVRLSLGGDPKYIAFHQVEGVPWDVMLVMPESEILAPVASLNTQLNQQITQTEFLSVGLTVGLLILAAIIAYFLSRNIAQPILAITDSAQYLATGQSMYQNQEMVLLHEQLAQRRDEVGDLSRAFDAIERYFEETSQLADQIAQGNLSVQVHRTSDQDRLGLALENMMSYLNQILQVATTLAAGDLSQDIQPHSSSDVLGNALKYMLDELRGLVVRVQSAAREIEAAAAFVLQRSAFLVEASERQMEQIIHATNEAGQMAESNHRVAEDTYTLARVAYSARGHAQEGYEAVQQTISGMNQIQEDVKQAAMRVSQLTRRSQEINRVIEVITNIAHQTNRLALDAAIHAQAAGANGRNFNMVATNIRHLSEQVKEEANQIAHLIQTIADETNQAIQASKQSQQRVAEGMGLASAAGTALEAIGNVVDQQGQLVEVINQIVRQQRDTSVLVAQEMQAASDITNQYGAGTRQTAQSIERLAYLARQLKESTDAFTLPGNQGIDQQRISQITGVHMRTPVRSARAMPLLPGGNQMNGGMNGGMNGM